MARVIARRAPVVVVLVVLAAPGCTQILGLSDDTVVDGADAGEEYTGIGDVFVPDLAEVGDVYVADLADVWDIYVPPDVWGDVLPVTPVTPWSDAGMEGGFEGGPSEGGIGPCSPFQPYQSDATHVACPPNLACDFTSTTTAVCDRKAGPGVQWDACTFPTDCAGGYTCRFVLALGHSVCERYCRVGPSFADCGSFFTCSPFPSPTYDGKEQIGLCSD